MGVLNFFVVFFLLCCVLSFPDIPQYLLEDEDSLDMFGVPRSIFLPFGTLHTIDKLSHWSRKEEDIYNALQLRREVILQEIDLITRFVSDYEETSGNTLTTIPLNQTSRDRGRIIGASPVLAHRMVDRYSTIVDQLRKLISSPEYYRSLNNVVQTLELLPLMNDNANLMFNWPNHQDLFVSLQSLLELQNFYDFDVQLVVDGMSLSFDTHYTGFLDLSHCTMLGVYGLTNGYHHLAIEWLEFIFEFTTLLEMKNGQVVGEANAKDFSNNVLQIAYQVHNYKLRQNNLPETFVHNSFMNPVKQNDSGYRVPNRVVLIEHYGKAYGNDSDDMLNMYSLCNGDDLQPQHIKSQLHCYLEKQLHPYFILNHLKTEELSKYPYVVQLYDALGNDTMNELYQARGEMGLSTVRGAISIDGIAHRSSAGAIPEAQYVYKIQNRSQILTGLLLTDMTEGIQTVEYVYGRYYKVHADSFNRPIGPVDVLLDPSIAEFGDRLATVLYYVDEPAIGGDTVFCQVGVHARPVRGSAIFWINMFRNGSVRADVSHSACPVIHGYKVIINQWIRYNSNFQTFKCGLDILD